MRTGTLQAAVNELRAMGEAADQAAAALERFMAAYQASAPEPRTKRQPASDKAVHRYRTTAVDAGGREHELPPPTAATVPPAPATLVLPPAPVDVIGRDVSAAVTSPVPRGPGGRMRAGALDDQILRLCAEHHGIGAADIAKQTRSALQTVYGACQRLVADGHLTVGADRKYRRAVAQPN